MRCTELATSVRSLRGRKLRCLFQLAYDFTQGFDQGLSCEAKLNQLTGLKLDIVAFQVGLDSLAELVSGANTFSGQDRKYVGWALLGALQGDVLVS